MTRFPFRIVADPNVLIAAAITRNPDSPVRTLVAAATQGRVQLITCPTLWAELTAVLARPKISSRLAPGVESDSCTPCDCSRLRSTIRHPSHESCPTPGTII